MAIDRAAPRAVRSQLEEGLRTAIRSGRLEPGKKLPSSRELARAIGVSRGLVTECYQQLQSEGYLHSEVGIGNPGRRCRGSPAAGADAADRRTVAHGGGLHRRRP